MLTIRNNFTDCATTVNPGKPLTLRRIKAIRGRLHGADCKSGDDLGGRGRQDDPAAYEELLLRAVQVVGSGRDEV